MVKGCLIRRKKDSLSSRPLVSVVTNRDDRGAREEQSSKTEVGKLRDNKRNNSGPVSTRKLVCRRRRRRWRDVATKRRTGSVLFSILFTHVSFIYLPIRVHLYSLYPLVIFPLFLSLPIERFLSKSISNETKWKWKQRVEITAK